MKLVKQKCCLHVDNVDIAQQHDSVAAKKHGPLFPSSIRAIICGPSNCGKTNVMISLLEDPNGLRFENVYVYSKSLFQPKYQYLRGLLQPLVGYYEYSDDADIIHPSEASPNSVFIFDDVACQTQSVIRDYFSMGRHKSIDSFYLCQTYTHIPKHLIRDNANLFIIFPMDDLNLRHIFHDTTSNMDFSSFDDFKKMCSLCWADKYSFLVISKDNDLNNGRYRKGFHCYIKLP